MNNPYAEHMSFAQRREFLSHINPDREVPEWVLELVVKQQTEGEIRELVDEYLQVKAEEQIIEEEWEAQQKELQDAGKALGFSCYGPWEDPLACMDGPCEACPFWQVDDIEYAILTEYLAQREHETEKERAEAEAGYVAEYHAWVLRAAQADLDVRKERIQQILAS